MVFIKDNRWIIFLVLMLFILIYCLWQNNALVVTKIIYESNRLPKEFDGFKIIHISDFHNKRFGKKQKRIANKIRKENPDIIIITGDLIDRRTYNLGKATEFISAVRDIAPIYYVAGNHEAWSNRYDEIEESLLKLDVKIMNDAKEEIVINDESISIMGLLDPSFYSVANSSELDYTKLIENLEELSSDNEFKIVLSHRAEIFEIYANSDVDLVFCGHAHGGQIIIPFVGPLIAPNQGFFPKYTSGAYESNGTVMIVSRGLGNSLFPVRINNRPEIISVTLNSK